jgi:DNA-binding transcriptional ArsR family regulator
LSPQASASFMIDMRLVEQPAPAGSRDVDQLIGWLLDTLEFVRRSGDDWAGDGIHSPIHRILSEFMLPRPGEGWDAQELGDELGLSPTAIQYQLSKLNDCGLTTGINRDGWRVHHLRNGSLSNAVEMMAAEGRLVLEQRLRGLDVWLTESDSRMTIPSEKGDEMPFRIQIKGRVPLAEGQDEMDAFLLDLGLYGDRVRRPKDGSAPLARQMFEHLLAAHAPLSLDEALELWGTTRPRLTRTLDRFRAAGLAERVPRLDRLAVTLWSAISSQYDRRGGEWLAKKGGLNRIDEKFANRVVKALEGGKFNVEKCEKMFADIPAKDQMILLNLQGGKLPVGWRLCGAKSVNVRERVLARSDRTFRRIKRVALTLEKALQS